MPGLHATTLAVLGTVRRLLEDKSNAVSQSVERMEKRHPVVRLTRESMVLVVKLGSTWVELNLRLCAGSAALLLRWARSVGRVAWGACLVAARRVLAALPVMLRLWKRAAVKCLGYSRDAGLYGARRVVLLHERVVLPAVSHVIFEYLAPSAEYSYGYARKTAVRAVKAQQEFLISAFPGSTHFIRQVLRIVAKAVVVTSSSYNRLLLH